MCIRGWGLCGRCYNQVNKGSEEEKLIYHVRKSGFGRVIDGLKRCKECNVLLDTPCPGCGRIHFVGYDGYCIDCKK